METNTNQTIPAVAEKAPAIVTYRNMSKDHMDFAVKAGKVKASWCQAVGAVPAIPAGELAVGNHIVYNYGSTSRVIAVSTKGQTVSVTTQGSETRNVYTQKYRVNRLVPIVVTISKLSMEGPADCPPVAL